ncbi:hypothetical protein HYV11_04060 [Candidatus Dependentiae bacterium]|nr:hypothetical protein [Candidatus Dependentiae bacterium]
MKKTVSLFALIAATALFAGCGGCCGGKKESSVKKTENHYKHEKKPKEKKHKEKKHTEKKHKEKKGSELHKIKKDADSVMKDL